MFLISNLFKLNKKCNHDKITPDMEFGYCPDCGKLIVNEWYITRCACCGVKLKAVSSNGEVHPQNKYCTNCGSGEYTVEKLPKINFIDINFAVLAKKVSNDPTNIAPTTQCWTEKTTEPLKLQVRYL